MVLKYWKRDKLADRGDTVTIAFCVGAPLGLVEGFEVGATDGCPEGLTVGETKQNTKTFRFNNNYTSGEHDYLKKHKVQTRAVVTNFKISHVIFLMVVS